jgi:hypothetical protein
MSSLGNVEMDHATIAHDMASMVRQSFVVGTAAACVAQIKAIGDALPVDPLVTRANWPGMDNVDVVAYLDGLGEEFIPALAEYQPVATYPWPAWGPDV